MWLIVVAFTFVNAAHAAGTMILGPVIADTTIGRQGRGFVVAAQTAGMVVGAVVALRLRVRRQLLLLLLGAACVAAFAPWPLVLALHPVSWLLMAAAFLAGVGTQQFGVAWETSLQHHVPQDRLARVYSYDMLGSIVAIPLAQLAVGPVSHLAGVRTTLLWCAAVFVVATAVMVASRSVRFVHNVPVTQAVH